MNKEDLELCISGRELISLNRKMRRKVALSKIEWRQNIREDMPNIKLRNAMVNRLSGDDSLDRTYTDKLDADTLERNGMSLLRSSHQPCPPLPCGADDSWMENAEYARLEAFAMLDAAAILRTREAHSNAPNIHAFDEQYYGDD